MRTIADTQDDVALSYLEISQAAASEPICQERRPKPVRTIADTQDDVALSYLEISQAAASEPICQERKPKPVRTIADGEDDVALSYLENYFPAPSPAKVDRAPFPRRVAAGLFDLLAVALLSSPFVGVLELAGFNWSDLRIGSIMLTIVLAMMFLYLTASTALTGRTLGMRGASIKAVDVRTGFIPSGGQSAKRAAGYILSLATLGLGFAYALLDAHGRTACDLFSGTILVRE